MKSEAIVEHLCASEFGKEECWGHGGAFLRDTGHRAPYVGWILEPLHFPAHLECGVAGSVAAVASSPAGSHGPSPR